MFISCYSFLLFPLAGSENHFTVFESQQAINLILSSLLNRFRMDAAIPFFLKALSKGHPPPSEDAQDVCNISLFLVLSGHGQCTQGLFIFPGSLQPPTFMPHLSDGTLHQGQEPGWELRTLGCSFPILASSLCL